MRAAILGAGSLGAGMGAMITNAGGKIDLIDGYKAHVEAINQNGVKVTGLMEMQARMAAYTLENIEGMYDIVIYLAKGPNNSTYLPAILPHLHKDSVFCVLQNGLPDDDVAKYIGWDRMIGGFVLWGASLTQPGVTNVTTGGGKAVYEIGEFDGKMTPRLAAVNDLMNKGAECTMIDNLMAGRWTKINMNAPMSGLSAALGCTYGDILANDTTLTSAVQIKSEVVKVAHAMGLTLLTVMGVDFDAFELRSKDDYARTKKITQEYYTPHSAVIASMLFDLRLGRSTEIDIINGAVSAKGRELGIETPFNDEVVALVKQAQREKSVPNFDNIQNFEKLVAQAESRL